ncbi:lipopolysaccharide biosynthesis protein [Thermococcus sp. GR7]|uniref:lipopolysaccharide biosynthesis protein n=1 Tax=unclassified Thermococcus TaxID=2627626 RepID=UPI0014319BA9|nr:MULTISPECIES: lipopolysaccharide biosynthesis protein [unclassified Thermococcus]NJE45910.1 lipopolysaccharide biosynthesis protein [Thermococcus sp. GR7]NJE78801.1 lipopolysaccharide biosynthesis protein [Thermococcus sp. GR4]NJF22105.1 lipopolysaccharide biosynthesis protein [Thermococcus sp. GR5]
MMRIIKHELKNFKNPLYKNSICLALASVISAFAAFVFWNVVSRLYSPADVGVASSLISMLNLIFGISLLGLNMSLIRFYPEYKDRSIGSALLISTSFAAVVALGYILLARTSSNFATIFSFSFSLLFVLISMMGAAFNILGTASIAMRNTRHNLVQNVLFSLRFVPLYMLVHLGIPGIIGSFGFGVLFGLTYIVFVLRGHISLSIDRRYLSTAFKFSLGNYIANIANIAPNYLMPTLVLTVAGREDAAYFFIAFTIGNMLLIVPNSINTSLFVEGSHGLVDLKQTLRKAILFSYLYLVIVIVFVWMFGEWVLAFFGPEYVRGLDLLKIVSLSGFLIVIVNFYVTMLNIQKKVKGVVIIYILKAVLFLGLSYLLVLRFGILGVGYGWVICNVVLVVLVYLMSLRDPI